MGPQKQQLSNCFEARIRKSEETFYDFFQLRMPTDFWCHAREENNGQCPLHGNSNAEGHQAVQEQLPTKGTRNIVLLHDDASSHK